MPTPQIPIAVNLNEHRNKGEAGKERKKYIKIEMNSN